MQQLFVSYLLDDWRVSFSKFLDVFVKIYIDHVACELCRKPNIRFVTIKDDLTGHHIAQRASMSFLCLFKTLSYNKSVIGIFIYRWNNFAAFHVEGFSGCLKTSYLWCYLTWQGKYALVRHGDLREQFKLRVSNTAENKNLTYDVKCYTSMSLLFYFFFLIYCIA